MQSALSSAYSSRQVSQIFAPDDEYQVMMQVAAGVPAEPGGAVDALRAGLGGKLIPLSSVVTTRQTVGPQSINHIGQLPSVTLSFNLQPGVALGDALARVQEMARQTLPATVTATPQGTAQAFEESMRGLGWILAPRDLRHLRRARDPLRELHPPADDSLGLYAERVNRT